MNDELPPMEKLIPAVEHLMGGLDHDAGLIQGIADNLVQHVGSSLDQDKATLKQVKNRLSRAITWDVLKNTGPVLTAIGGRMRAAVAQAVDADQQRVDALAARLPPMLERPVPGGGPHPPIPHPPSSVPPTVLPSSYGFWECPNPTCQWVWVYAWYSTYDPNRPPDGPPPGGDPAGHARQSEQCNGRFVWWNSDGSIASCQPTGLPPPSVVPPGPPPVPILPPPVPIGPPIAPPPVPAHSPASVPVADVCGPLPAGIPKVAVYQIPWLDPGDPSASAFSECGLKMIADAQYTLVPAAPIAAALSRPMGYPDVVSDLDQGEDSLPSNAGLIYRQ